MTSNQLATTNEVTEKYAGRVIAAMIEPGIDREDSGFRYSTADEIAAEHVEIEAVIEDPMRHGEWCVLADITGANRVVNTDMMSLFDFVLASGIDLDTAGEDVTIDFAGFQEPQNGELSIHEEDGLVRSENADKIRFELTLPTDGGA
jgi:hypothetical protein